jgi:hypothetical protein
MIEEMPCKEILCTNEISPLPIAFIAEVEHG